MREGFDHYMDAVCGLTANTRKQRGQIFSRVLTARFGSGPIAAPAIIAADLRRFVLGSETPYSAGTVRVMASALRCYLRFRTLAGDPVGNLG